MVKHSDFYAPSENGILIYFATEDIPRVLKNVTAAGGKVLQEKKQITPNTYMGLFLDAEGYRIAFHCRD